MDMCEGNKQKQAWQDVDVEQPAADPTTPRSFLDAALARMAATGMRGVTSEQQRDNEFIEAALARMAATGMRGVTIEQQLESDKKAEQESKVKPQLEEDILRRQQRGSSGSCCWLRGLSTPIQVPHT